MCNQSNPLPQPANSHIQPAEGVCDTHTPFAPSPRVAEKTTLTQQIDIARRNLREFGAACITPPIFAALLEGGELDGRRPEKVDQTAVDAWWREIIKNQED